MTAIRKDVAARGKACTAERFELALKLIACGEANHRAIETAGTTRLAFYHVLATDEEAQNRYARAKALGLEAWAADAIEIADTPREGVIVTTGPKGTETKSGDMIEARRLQVETRKWMLAKLLPKRYGDKVQQEISGPGGGPVQTEAVTTDWNALKASLPKRQAA